MVANMESQAASTGTVRRQKGHRWFAALWDTISAPAERRWGRKTIRPRLMGEVQGLVLEIGAGNGHSFPFYPREARVMATDPDPHMLERAQKSLDQLGLTNIELRQASAEALPFDDASFDHVVSSMVLCSVRDLPGALAEARRVLKPGGTLRFWEHVRNDESRFWGSTQDMIMPVWRWFGAGCHPNRRTAHAIEEAGFRVEWLEWIRVAFEPVIYGVARRD